MILYMYIEIIDIVINILFQKGFLKKIKNKK